MTHNCLKKNTIRILAASFCFGAQGLSAAGTSSASFLRIGWSARAASMGDAFTAVADDIDALYWNPAGLNGVKRLQESFGHNKWIAGMNVEHVSFAFRSRPAYALGFGLGYLNTGDIDRADKYGNSLGYYSAGDTVLIFSYARVWKPGWKVGGNFKIVNERIEESGGKGFGLDIGTIYEMSPKTKLGFSLKNFGKGINLSKTAGSLPMSLRAGMAYQYRKDILLASDLNMSLDDSFSLHFGGEYLYPSKVRGLKLVLRAGLKSAGMGYLGSLSALSLGFGAEKGNVTVDYSLNPYGAFGMAHRLELKMKFETLSSGKTAATEKAEEKINQNPQGVYKETLQWLDARIESEKLSPEQQAVLLEKLIEKFSAFGADVTETRARVERLKNGAK